MCLSGKPRGKKIRGKSRGERDLLKERLLRRDNSVPDDKDETSSTTTDSSAGGEQEDKVSEQTFCSQEIEAAAMFSRGGTTQVKLTLSCIHHHHQGCGCGSAPPPRGGKWGWQAQVRGAPDIRAEFSSVQFKMVRVCSEKPVRTPPCLTEVSPALPCLPSG